MKTEKDKISIEHIYPQTETDEWAKAFTEVSVGNRRYYNATLGNLLLLSASINSSLQNDSFVEKKKAKYNAAKEKVRNGYSDGSHSEIEVSQQDIWGPEQINDRGIKLLTFMEKRWDLRFKSDAQKRSILFLDFVETDEKVQQQESA
ncbi:MAG: HNH endonuclease family protein [Flavisolibacter sp.]